VVLPVAHSIALNNGTIVNSKLGPVLKEAVVVKGEVLDHYLFGGTAKNKQKNCNQDSLLSS